MSDQLVALLNLRQRISTLGGGGGGGGNTESGVTVQQLNALREAVARLDLSTPRVKAHPVQVATAGQTIFSAPEPFDPAPGRLLVYSGGVLVDSYTIISPTQIQFTSGREANEKIQLVEIQIGSENGSTVVDEIAPVEVVTTDVFEDLLVAVAVLDRLTPRIRSFLLTATAGQTLFTLPEPYSLGQNSLLVFSGGVLVDSYTEVSPTQIEFTSARAAGEKIQVIKIQLGADAGVTVVDGLALGSAISAEIPTGLVNSTNGSDGNGTFTVAFPVDPAITPRVYVGSGLALTNSMFSRVDRVFTINPPYKPVIGESITILYKRST